MEEKKKVDTESTLEEINSFKESAMKSQQITRDAYEEARKWNRLMNIPLAISILALILSIISAILRLVN